MNPRSRAFVFCCSLLLTNSVVHAAPIDWDGQPGSLGFNAIRNGDHVWTDLRVTRGMSYSNVVADIGPGLQFDGWRVASADETIELLNSAGLSFGSTLSNRQKVRDLFSIWGGPLYAPVPDFYGEAGLIVGDLTIGAGGVTPAREAGGISYEENFGNVSCCGNWVADNFASTGYAVLLVRQIPEPASLLLGLFCACYLVSVHTRTIRNRCSCGQRG